MSGIMNGLLIALLVVGGMFIYQWIFALIVAYSSAVMPPDGKDKPKTLKDLIYCVTYDGYTNSNAVFEYQYVFTVILCPVIGFVVSVVLTGVYIVYKICNTVWWLLSKIPGVKFIVSKIIKFIYNIFNKIVNYEFRKG